jgi:hypothetical protein
MTYIIQRQDRFYVVAYDGLDPLTGKESRRWHPAGHDRADAEAIARQLDDHRIPAPPTTESTTLASFLREMWIPLKLCRLRVDHLDRAARRPPSSPRHNLTSISPVGCLRATDRGGQGRASAVVGARREK